MSDTNSRLRPTYFKPSRLQASLIAMRTATSDASSSMDSDNRPQTPPASLYSTCNGPSEHANDDMAAENRNLQKKLANCRDPRQ